MSIAFPGYVPDVHTADALDPAWGNAIRDRAPQVFDTAANRDAAITVPQVGQSCVLTNAASGVNTGVYVYVGATDGWARPWNMPWGAIACATVQGTQGSITTEVDLTSMTVTFTAVANRQYRIEAIVPFSGTAGDTARAKITDGANAQKKQDQVSFTVGSSSYQVNPWLMETYAAGSVTRKLRAIRQAGAGGAVTMSAGATDPCFLYVTDEGPTGAPS